jgi:hypothetical protein
MIGYMAKARLFLHAKKIFPDGSIREMVIWQLPSRSIERPHGLKYRLYFGNASGECRSRYDNETGKGDHRHFGEQDESYVFTTIEQLVADFQRDIDRMRAVNEQT